MLSSGSEGVAIWLSNYGRWLSAAGVCPARLGGKNCALDGNRGKLDWSPKDRSKQLAVLDIGQGR